MKKLYVIVLSKLSKSQQAVQAAHAVAQYCIDFPDSDWDNHTLVLLKTRSLTPFLNMAHSLFREPYFGSKITALAHYGSGDNFKHLGLI